MRSRTTLANLSERQLLTRLDDLVRRDRHRTAQLLAVIAEIDQRKLWAKHACPSMFAFCMERFHMSESTTAKRIWAARTARRFPLILKMVARGELHLTAIAQLARHLTEDNHHAVLLRAKHKSSREIELLVAELAPRPDVPSRIQALPTPAAGSRAAGETSGQATGQACEPTPGRRGDQPATTGSRAAGDAPNAPYPRRRQVVVLAPRRYKIEITVDQQTHDNLRMLQDLLSHQVPGADPATIVSRAIDRLLADALKKKAAISDRPGGGDGRRDGSSDRPRERGCGHTQRSDSSSDRRSGRRTGRWSGWRSERRGDRRTRAIPAAIRREVWRRDAGVCTFVDERGHRCRGTRRIEYHHEKPYGRGGGHETANIALRCRAHNQYQADLDFGTDFMRRKRGGAGGRSARNARCPAVRV